MPKIKSPGGVNLYYEEAGAGTPVGFVHEFAGAENGRWLAHKQA